MSRFRLRRRLGKLVAPRKNTEIYPDEIFLDASNLPAFDRSQMEGRIEKPISRRSIRILLGIVILVILIFSGRLFILEVVRGAEYEELSQNNRLKHSTIFADRGIIYDSRGEELAWNEPNPYGDFSLRKYSELPGLAHVIGYVTYPKQDSSGNYYETDFQPKDGVEESYNAELSGTPGVKIVETDAKDKPRSESVLELPRSGKNITLSLDAQMSSALYKEIARLANEVGFAGGAGVLMDVRTGEVIALTSFPEYDPNVMASGSPKALIEKYLGDPGKPFLNRDTSGLYTPGSIIKPFIAAGALTEGIISPEKQILSTGQISIPNPYDPTKETVFKDWKAHGYVDMRHALAVSSDVYFYEVGGGFESQKGLGIANIEKYMRMFGFGSSTGLTWSGEAEGSIPSPQWKALHFPDDPTWRIGNTYHSAIGQYGFQVTLMQVVRAVGAIANGGRLITPTILSEDVGTSKELPLSDDVLQIVREGMRLATREGTATALNFPEITIAAKTGTAELGASKDHVNSWVTGFFPYENPRYAFAITMERGRSGNLIGASAVARSFFEWLYANRPEIVQE